MLVHGPPPGPHRPGRGGRPRRKITPGVISAARRFHPRATCRKQNRTNGAATRHRPRLLLSGSCGDVVDGRVAAGELAEQRHVYRAGTLVVKWDLEHRMAMKGTASPRVLVLIQELESEGLL